MRVTKIATLVVAMLAMVCATAEVRGAGDDFELVFVQCLPSEPNSSEYSAVPNAKMECVFLTLADVASYDSRSHTLVLKPKTVAAYDGRPIWLELERYALCGGFEVRVHGRSVYSGLYHSVTRSDIAGPGIYVRGDFGRAVTESRISLVLEQPCSDPRDNPELMKVFENAGVLIK